MHKQTKIMIVVVFVLVIVVVVMFSFLFLKSEKIVINEDFVLLDKNYSKKENIVFTSYEDFSQKFSSNILSEEDFKNNNYVLITISDNSCKGNIAPTDYAINGNNIMVTAKYKARCKECPINYMAYLLKVSKNIEEVVVSINFVAINNVKCN